MIERQLAAMEESPPLWLLKLVEIAHAKRLTLVSFNYDTLVEKATAVRRLVDWGPWYSQFGEDVTAAHVVGDLPPTVCRAKA